MDIKKIVSNALIFFLVAQALLVFYRIHFSVDFHDEPFYIAMTYHYLLGGKPFVDESNLTQTTSLLLYPIYSLFFLIHKSTSGIVLFSRYLYVVFTLGVFLTLYAFFKRIIDKNKAMLIAFIPVVFTPFLIYSCSYNTLSSLLLMTGIIILFYGITHQGFSFFSGLCVGAACFCYPTFTLVAILLLVLTWIYQCSWKFILYYFLGLTIFALILAYFLLSAGSTNVWDLYFFAKSVGTMGGSFHKIIDIFVNFYHAFPHKKFFIAIYALAFIAHIRFKMSYFIGALLMISILILQGWIDKNFMIQLCLIGFIAPFLYFFARKHPLANPILILIWLPGFVGACISGWTSGNGWYNAIIGGLAMPIATFLYVFLLSEQLEFDFNNVTIKNIIRFASVFLMVITLAALTRSHFVANYRDLPNSTLIYKVTSGPFSDLYTTPENGQFLIQLQSDLLSVATQNKSVLFFDDFPAGYLLTTMKPQTNSIWLFSTASFPKFNKDLTFKYFQNTGQYPDVIVKMLGVADNPKNDPFQQFIQSHYHKIVKRERYAIYGLQASCLCYNQNL